MELLKLVTVDDEQHIHDGLDAIIDWEKLGCVHAGNASNGAAALQLITAVRPDIILTDIKMPVMNGLDLIKSVVELPDYKPAVIVMSGYDEFAYAQTALRYGVIDYLLKPIDEDELARCIEKILIRYKRQSVPGKPGVLGYSDIVSVTFRRLALAASTESSDKLNELTGFGLKAPFAFGLIVPLAADDSCLTPETTHIILSASILKDAAACVYQDFAGTVGILITRNVLLCDDEAVNGGECNLGIKALMRAIIPGFSYDIKMVVGEIVPGLSEIHRSRQSVLAHMEKHHIVEEPGYTIVSASDLEQINYIDRNEVTRLMKCIEECRLADAESFITLLFRKLKQHGVSSVALREWLYILLYEIKRLITSFGVENPPGLASVERVIRNIEFIRLSVIASALAGYLEEVITDLSGRKNMVRYGKIVLLQRTIERNYADEISLNDFAEKVNMNSNYIGQLFRQVVGKGFKEYQRECRMREACRILRETDRRIADIALQVGYQDYDYFVAQFKREMHMTPSQFRNA